MIYLASPYSHEREDMMVRRWQLACRACAILLNRGHNVISPIAHSHPIKTYGNVEGGWLYRQRLDLELVRRCDEVWVLMLKGWEESIGVLAEVEYATNLGKPVRFVDPSYLMG